MSEHSTRWVDRLFSRLHIRYGDAWLRKWDGLPLDAVKADWQQMLGTLYARCPEALAYALEHLPADFPPNSDGFLRIALGYQSPMEKLPPPATKVDAKVLEVVKQAMEKPEGYDPGRECADKLRARKMGGRLSIPQAAQLKALEEIGK